MITALVFMGASVCTNAAAQSSNPSFEPYQLIIPGSTLKYPLVPIPAGALKIKSTDSIVIPAFWMGAVEITRDAFDVFYNNQNISQNDELDAVTRPSPQYIDFSNGMGKEGGYPVNSLSQYAALMYCRWLYQETGVFYRLPSEAEWDYAYYAGKSPQKTLDSTALLSSTWFATNSNKKFHKVGLTQPNAWGLYDMTGNVTEWTLDHFKHQDSMPVQKEGVFPVAFQPNTYPKITKGGHYLSSASFFSGNLRIPSDPVWNRRDPQEPKSRWWITDAPFVGFRIVRPLIQPSKEEIEKFFQTYLAY